MPEVYFRQSAALVLDDVEDPKVLAGLKEGLPRSAQRRMTLMGLMLHRLLEGRTLDADTAIIYLTAFGESRTMEKYLESFPMPSPMGFQSSIHPSGVEQSLILRRQPVRFFLPLAGRDALFQALRTATTLPAGTILASAEERGGWLARNDLSSRVTFSWALTLADREEAEGSFAWEADAGEARESGRASGLAWALAEREAWAWKRPGLGTVRLQWR